MTIEVYADLAMRCALIKPWPALEPKLTLGLGKFSDDKILELGRYWARFVDKKYHGLGFAAEAGLAIKKQDVVENASASQEVNLASLRALKANPSDSSAPEPYKEHDFARGGAVTVCRNVVLRFEGPEKNNVRKKTIAEGTTGVIEGWADRNQKKVLLKLAVDFGEGEETLVHEASPNYLMLTSDYKLASTPVWPAAKGEEAETGDSLSSSGSGGQAHEVPDWALEQSQHEHVRVEPTLTNLLADDDKGMKRFFVTSRIGGCLEALLQTLPAFSDEDLQVVHRKGEKGIWKDELWTKRDFRAFELQLAPISSQLKDTNLTAAHHAIVGLPESGKCQHPDGKQFAFDGRGKTFMAEHGSISDGQRLGSFFWLVAKTGDSKAANMEMQSTAFECDYKLTLPAAKRRRTSHVSWVDMPEVPVYVNRKAIKENTQLVVYIAEKKADVKTAEDLE